MKIDYNDYGGRSYLPESRMLKSQTPETFHKAVRAYVRRAPGKTATQITNFLGLKKSSVSSYLVKEIKAGRMFRKEGVGPRGGWGYWIVPQSGKNKGIQPTPVRTAWERLAEDWD